MGIFKKKPKQGVVMASAPVEPETPAEVMYTENVGGPQPVVQPVAVAPVSAPVAPVAQPVAPAPVPQYTEIPVCMSETQIYNMIIDNNIMLKHIISIIEEAE